MLSPLQHGTASAVLPTILLWYGLVVRPVGFPEVLSHSYRGYTFALKRSLLLLPPSSRHFFLSLRGVLESRSIRQVIRIKLQDISKSRTAKCLRNSSKPTKSSSMTIICLTWWHIRLFIQLKHELFRPVALPRSFAFPNWKFPSIAFWAPYCLGSPFQAASSQELERFYVPLRADRSLFWLYYWKLL